MNRYHLWTAPAYYVIDRETGKPASPGYHRVEDAEKAMAALEEIETTNRELLREEDRRRAEEAIHGRASGEDGTGQVRLEGDEGRVAAGTGGDPAEADGSGDDLGAPSAGVHEGAGDHGPEPTGEAET